MDEQCAVGATPEPGRTVTGESKGGPVVDTGGNVHFERPLLVATAVSPTVLARGAGELRRVRQSILGQVMTAVPCSRCQGTGQAIATPCEDCGGDGRRDEERTLEVDIPSGVDDGTTLRLSGHGPAGFRGGPNGALFVHLSVEADPVFERSGVDVHASVQVAMTQAALG